MGKKTSVIPTGAERSKAKWRDHSYCNTSKKGTLDYAANGAASSA